MRTDEVVWPLGAPDGRLDTAEGGATRPNQNREGTKKREQESVEVFAGASALGSLFSVLISAGF